MRKHDCVDCDYMKFLEDNSGRIIYFCMFDQSIVIFKKLEFMVGMSWTDL